MFCSISRNDEKGYTYLVDVFHAINNAQKNYNWLISYPELNVDNIFADKFTWITGEKLTLFAEKNPKMQWIWGVLSGFEKDISKEDVVNYKLGLADEFNGYYQTPASFYHPLATIEIAPCDSSWLVLSSKEKRYIDNFNNYFLCEDLPK